MLAFEEDALSEKRELLKLVNCAIEIGINLASLKPRSIKLFYLSLGLLLVLSCKMDKISIFTSCQYLLGLNHMHVLCT